MSERQFKFSMWKYPKVQSTIVNLNINEYFHTVCNISSFLLLQFVLQAIKIDNDIDMILFE